MGAKIRQYTEQVRVRGILDTWQELVPEGEAGVKCYNVCRAVRKVKSSMG